MKPTFTFEIRVTWEDGREIKFTKTTKWNAFQVRSWVCRKYADCQYVYMSN